ncbi:MAG: cupin domain-containing protein, partial [Kiritimatiellae bacterium]|nr:cupin domain-containing protein [Kiritimatiellia bacterium]
DKPDPIIPSVDPDPSGSETVDSNEKGAIALAKRIEEFVERLAYGNDKFVLKPGDTAYYNSVVRHSLKAVGGNPASIYGVVFMPF